MIAYYEKMRPEQKKCSAYAKGIAYAKNAEAQAWLELGLDNNLVAK
ncbi:MAG: hypothetical protein M1569_01690 [Candidatus Marsarchaeota archaeon]|nr:hypothetical protein [Candidatus Marsarchaeota archaeon]MCL5413094.1 hypothetical protein [Candidatus Marsarchaeota archaeon]